MKKTFLIVSFSWLILAAMAQDKGIWHNKKCAVVLTYDDAIGIQLDNALPALDSLELKATFYLSGFSEALSSRLPEWKAAAKNGHELGNHTLFHPCTGKIAGREWVAADYDLSNYTVRRMTDEIRLTNTLLKAIDGKKERTFAYPCGDTKIGDVSYLNGIKGDFAGARGVRAQMLKIEQLDLYNVEAYGVNGESAEQLIGLVKNAMENNTLLVFIFHGVGGGHSLNVGLNEHSKLLHFLKQQEREVWVAPFIEVVKYAKKYNDAIKR